VVEVGGERERASSARRFERGDEYGEAVGVTLGDRDSGDSGDLPLRGEESSTGEGMGRIGMLCRVGWTYWDMSRGRCVS
jgi:hypothetical protein